MQYFRSQGSIAKLLRRQSQDKKNDPPSVNARIKESFFNIVTYLRDLSDEESVKLIMERKVKIEDLKKKRNSPEIAKRAKEMKEEMGAPSSIIYDAIGLALLEFLLGEINHDDKELINDMIRGFATTGKIEQTGLWKPLSDNDKNKLSKNKKRKLTKFREGEPLRKQDKEVQESFQGVKSYSQKDIENLSYSKLFEDLGLPSSKCTKIGNVVVKAVSYAFGVVQFKFSEKLGNWVRKVRVCADDRNKNSHTEISEKITLEDVRDFMEAVAIYQTDVQNREDWIGFFQSTKSVQNDIENYQRRLKEGKGSNAFEKDKTLHKGQDKLLALYQIDLIDAYFQMAIEDVCANIVGFFDYDLGEYRYVFCPHLLFGTLSSVYAFLRLSSALTAIGRSYFKLGIFGYFDDFNGVEPRMLAESGFSTFLTLIELLGFKAHQTPPKSQCTLSGNVLGVHFNFESIPFSEIPWEKKTRVFAMIEDVKEDVKCFLEESENSSSNSTNYDTLHPFQTEKEDIWGTAEEDQLYDGINDSNDDRVWWSALTNKFQKISGSIIFILFSCLFRGGYHLIRPLFRLCNDSCTKSMVTDNANDIFLYLENLNRFLVHIRPFRFSFSHLSDKVTRVLTDASLSHNGGFIGGIIFQENGINRGFSYRVPGAEKYSCIMFLEVLAVFVCLELYSGLVRGRVFFGIDNQSGLFSIIKGYCKGCNATSCLVYDILRKCSDNHLAVWWAYIWSQLNASDGLSRPELLEEARNKWGIGDSNFNSFPSVANSIIKEQFLKYERQSGEPTMESSSRYSLK